jgi:N-acyl-D-amino-acid deacylase
MPSAGLCDLIFESGRIIDGLGGPAQPGAVCVRDGRIVHVGPDDGGWTASDRIDLGGRSLAPGFIDCHTHDDQYLFIDPAMAPKVSQGVTTVVTGNCGVSLAPLLTDGAPPAPLTEVGRPGDFRFATFGDYLDALDASPPAVNAACLVGHTTLRAAVMPRVDRPASAAEIAQMEAMCESAMEAGAIGVSSGLFYPPAMPAPASEVTGLARIAARHGGVYTAHIRNEADDVAEGLEEAFLIAREAGAPLVISHHKVSGSANFGRSRETLRMIGRAATSQRIGLDVYPYAASSTMLNRASWSASTRTLVTWSKPHPEAAGRELREVAAAMGLSEEEALDALSPGGAVYFMMDEADVRRIIASPNAMIGSDGVPMNTRPHPRLWGAFTRVLGHYVRDVGLFPIEEAVRRMTSLPAQQFRLTDRGVIAPGAAADLVILDPAKVSDRATFEAPDLPSEGIDAVYVAGVCIWRAGAPTGARPGRVLRLADAEAGRTRMNPPSVRQGSQHLA